MPDQDVGDQQKAPPGGSDASAENALASLVTSLVEAFAGEPGFMVTGAGFEVLHADWPAYPSGHGARYALTTLGDFPADTTFFVVDRIDLCTLFVAGSVLPPDPFSRNHYHLALWDGDLSECLRQGFLDGPQINSDGRLGFLAQQMRISPRGQ